MYYTSTVLLSKKTIEYYTNHQWRLLPCNYRYLYASNMTSNKIGYRYIYKYIYEIGDFQNVYRDSIYRLPLFISLQVWRRRRRRRRRLYRINQSIEPIFLHSFNYFLFISINQIPHWQPQIRRQFSVKSSSNWSDHILPSTQLEFRFNAFYNAATFSQLLVSRRASIAYKGSKVIVFLSTW